MDRCAPLVDFERAAPRVPVFRIVPADARQESDFGGVFEFASLDRFIARQPYAFRINRGDPFVSFTRHEAFDFIQDQVLLTPNLQLVAGLRHEWHGSLGKSNTSWNTSR